MFAYRIAYDGTGYRGFQRQPHKQTVSDRVLKALDEHGVEPVGYAAAGRTDAGVSALAQTVAFEAPEWLVPRALNGHLPDDVFAWARADVSPDFHPTHDAAARTYAYYLHAPGADSELVGTAMDALAGAHDFHNFTTDDEGTERRLETALAREGSTFELRFSAGGFARGMVRRLAELVRGVGVGEVPPERVGRALGPEALDGPRGVAPAPPGPLALVGVSYPGVEFDPDERAVRDARRAFGAARDERLGTGRALGALADVGT
jgi:tRNA pseudouridine38-40 synthase